MTLTVILIILGIAVWVALMMMVAILPFRPHILRITETFVCPVGSKMEVGTYVATYHKPGQKGLIVTYTLDGETKDIKVKALLILWVIFYMLSIVITGIGAMIFFALRR